MARQLLLSSILLLFLQETSSDGKPSSCSIPSVEVGGTAVLTCKFDTNIYETKDSFQVERYSTAKNKQESLLACQWISEKLECHRHASVWFDQNITNTFQVYIPFVTSDDFGEYVCHVLPTPDGISKRCYLNRIDNSWTTHHYLSALMTTLRGHPKSRPLIIGGDNGTRFVLYLSGEREEFITYFQLKGHPSPGISSIQVTGKSEKHYTLQETVHWKQSVLPNVPEPFITTIFLSIMTSPVNLFNDYEMNVTNSEGTATVHFQVKSLETTNKGSNGFEVIIAYLSVAVFVIFIFRKIGGVVRARLNQLYCRYKLIPLKNPMPEDENYDGISSKQHGVGMHERRTRKSKPYRRHTAPPSIPEDKDNDDISSQQHGVGMHERRTRKSKPYRRHTAPPSIPEDKDNDDISSQQHDEIHGWGNQMYMEGQTTSI